MKMNTAFRLGRSLCINLGVASVGITTIAYAQQPFQQRVNSACGGTDCQIDFAQVPRNSRLEISNVSCSVSTIGGGEIGALELVVQRRNGLFDTVVELVSFPHSGGFVSNNIVTAFATHGERVYVYVQTTNTLQGLACHISGQIVTVP